MAGTRKDRLRLYGSFGSGKVMAGELSRLVRRAYDDFRVVPPEKDGASSIVYAFDPRLAAVALAYHRTSARVLWELFHSNAQRLEPLYDDLRQLVQDDRRAWLDGAESISVQTHFVGAFAAGERQIVGTVKNAIIDGARDRGIELRLDPEHPDLYFDVRVDDGTVMVGLDLAGRPMHQRGYRRRAGVAPLREDVAALLVMLTRYDGRREILVDPMAGSGTLAIEAACMASGRYNWCSGRQPAARRLPVLGEWLAERPKALFPGTEPRIAINDHDAAVLELARINLETAGVAKAVAVRSGDFRDWTPEAVMSDLGQAGSPLPSGGVILANPPYGKRLGDAQDGAKLHAELGDWCGRFKGFRAGFIVTDPDFPRDFGRRPRSSKPVRNGALKATFHLFEL